LQRQPPPGAIARLSPGSITAEVITPSRPDSGGGHTLQRTHWSENCPFGHNGDRVWWRESGKVLRDGGTPDAANDTDCTIQYAADRSTQDFSTGKQLLAASERRRPAAHLPRWASRITYTIVDVRLQRLHQMSEQDALDEGADPFRYHLNSALEAMRYFWTESGLGHWEENPWVWQMKVKRVRGQR